MYVQRCSKIVGFLVVASIALPVSAQVEEMEQTTPDAQAASDVEARPETKTWASPKLNQVFFRGGHARLAKSRGDEVFTDTDAATGANDGRTGFSIAAGLDLALTEPADMRGLVLLGEIYIEYARFSKNDVLQTTSALLGGTDTSDVHVAELNVTVAPKFRYDGWKVVRPYFIPVGLAFLVNSPPSNDSTYLDIGLHFAGGFDFVVIDEFSLGVDFRYTYAFDQSNTNNSYMSTGAYAGVNF